jgi:peptidoglycan/xylan/chitin deacetylase (PgdA/CDA1 family)
MTVMMYVVLAIVVLVVANRYQLWRIPKPSYWPRLLMYHSIAPDAPTGMNTPPAIFEWQVAWLKKQGYCFCTLSELLANTAKTKKIAITFDDGFANNYHHAFAILQKYQAKATIYLAPDIAEIDKLTPAQITEMQASGLIEFGAHSLHHVNLSQSDAAQAQAEITGSKQRVEQLTGQPCMSFAYPFGRFNQQVVEWVKQAGFSSAVTTQKKIIANPQQSAFIIPRISTHGAMSKFQFYVAVSRGRYKF